MSEVIFGVATLVGGAALLVFRKQFARACIANQNRLWGFHFGARDVKRAEIVAVIAAIGWIVMGLLALTGVIHMKQ